MKRFRPHTAARFYANTKRKLLAAQGPRAEITPKPPQMTEASAQQILDEAAARLRQFPTPLTRRYAQWQAKRVGIDLRVVREALRFVGSHGK